MTMTTTLKILFTNAFCILVIPNPTRTFLYSSAIDFNTWLLYFQYAACFGVELTMNNYTATYFVDHFGLTTESASAIASIFGFMNIFARGLGGFTSDKFMNKYGMRGRIIWQATTLIMEGICIFLFASVDALWAAILLLTIFSIFVQAAEGSTYGIVPYVNTAAPGAVSGIVGAGGPTGAVVFGFFFRQISNVKTAYYFMAGLVVLSGLSCLLICIKGHCGLLYGTDDGERPALELPEAEDLEVDEVVHKVGEEDDASGSKVGSSDVDEVDA